jgi:hypothetical protein
MCTAIIGASTYIKVVIAAVPTAPPRIARPKFGLIANPPWFVHLHDAELHEPFQSGANFGGRETNRMVPNRA